MSAEEAGTERFLSLVGEAQAEDPSLTPLQAALIVAARLGIASDSRTFARVIGVAHALVLRELGVLEAEGARLRIIKRDARTMRSWYALADNDGNCCTQTV